MIEKRRPVAPARGPWWLAALVAVATLVAGATHLGGDDKSTAPSSAFASSAPGMSASPGVVAVVAPPAPPRVVASSAPPPLSLSGPVPSHGKGKFAYAAGRGPMLGKSGPVRHFKVAVERGSGEDVTEFTNHVEATLGDQRGWVGDGKSRLQRVPGSERADFTIFLATRDTAGKMCAAGGTNIRVGGRPYTSCRTPGKAIVNLDRWRLSAAPYRKAKIPLWVYRQYVINHEVGHEFGHHHEGCPLRGGPAPVMVQQTLNLRGCVPYAWPRKAGGRLAGPRL